MTTLDIVRAFHAKPAGKDKWRAKCPIHGGRYSGPLKITRDKGRTLMNCFGGCETRAVLEAVGLRLSDLYEDSRIDPEVIRQIREVEARREAERQERTRLLQLAKERKAYWHGRVETLGKALYVYPQPDSLRKDFDYAVGMERRCQKIWETL